MAIRKSELYSSLWKSCDELRGGMDASQYKDYVLALLFLKYVSDKYAGQPDAVIVVPDGGSFADMVQLKGDTHIGDKINKIISKLAEANDLKGVIDIADFNDDSKLGKGKEMVDRLSNLIAIFENPALDFSKNRAEGDDILGDAYEYLMRHFATESGKSKGQFYTPAEVSRVMAKVIGIRDSHSQEQTIYDPTCGSGSLLLKAADEAPHGISIHGQEKDIATTALARMNMILHKNPTAIIAPGGNSTLSSPYFLATEHRLTTFDFVVANPPFSYKSWSSGFVPSADKFDRFTGYGVPPTKNGDFAFLLHIVRSLKSTGKGACILPHGVLFRGNAEGEIRKNLVRRGVIKGIIGLPPNLFYGTGIPACIVVLDKEHAPTRRGIFMIDASKGFIKDGNKNRLRHQDIHKIVDVFNRQREVPKYARMVPVQEIEANDYNLNIPRYIDSAEPEDLQDIDAHLRGGIPERDIDGLAGYWAVCPTLRDALFGPGDRAGYGELRPEPAEIKPAILGNPEFAALHSQVEERVDAWCERHQERLKRLAFGDQPKLLIEAISEDILAEFEQVPLLDKYDVYQHLMTYWTETMQDDVYLVVGNGWKEATRPRVITDDKEKPDLTIGRIKYRMDLVPPSLIVECYFTAEQEKIETLAAEHETVQRKIEELAEEHGGEDGLLAEATNEKGQLTKALVNARMVRIREELDLGKPRKGQTEILDFSRLGEDAGEEWTELRVAHLLLEEETEARRRLKAALDELDEEVWQTYDMLTEDEIKTLVVDYKWLVSLADSIYGEIDHLSQNLAARARTLAERYSTPLPQLVCHVEALSARVDEHLARMGVTWK